MNKFITSWIVCAILLITPVSVFLYQNVDTLEDERRRVASFPDIPKKVSVPEVRHFFNDFDAFFADHFPLRGAFISFSSYLHESVGESLDMDKCYPGKDGWLFLGNAYGRYADKLQGLITLSDNDLQRYGGYYTSLSEMAHNNGSEFVIFIGSNKYDVYSEYLPPVITPAPERFTAPLVSFLRNKGVKVYDPHSRLIEKKNTSLLYYKTDTHWNYRGAHVAFDGFNEFMGYPKLPSVSFVAEPGVAGDLINVGGFRHFPLSADDNVSLNWENPVSQPITDKTVWVFSDSFGEALRPYMDVTFKEVTFFKHLEFESVLSSPEQKPDLILWVIVERDFIK